MKTIDSKYFKNPEKYIPKGFYCYDYLEKKLETDGSWQRKMTCIGLCPFLDTKEDEEKQSNGYCHFLQLGDWMLNGTSLLWDMCKECGINNYSDDEIEQMFS